MLDQRRAIIFEVPNSNFALSSSYHGQRQCKCSIGSANKKIVEKIMQYNGISVTQGSEFSIFWTTPRASESIRITTPYQKINHFPRSQQLLGNKAALANIIQQNHHLSRFPPFFPVTFNLPADRDELFEYMKSNPVKPFIAKPPGGSCGNGIKIVNYSDYYLIPRGSVVSEYISRPLCIDGFKFDLRVYVLVTSFAPLRAFLYKDGLARFATESYSNYSNNALSHLTNATLNKHGRNWGEEFKWRLADLLSELEVRYHRPVQTTMSQIIEIVSRTLALIQPSMAPKKRQSPTDSYFELYGIDILIDRSFNMWLLEINTNPSLAIDTETDTIIKGTLVAQTLSIVGIHDIDWKTMKCISPTALPEGMTIDEYEAELIRLEDERNELSGGGYIRLFPSEATKELNHIITNVRFQPHVFPKNFADSSFDPVKLGKLLSSDQATAVLLIYLSRMERKLKLSELSPKASSKLQKFLLAQGYKVQRVTTNLAGTLRMFILHHRNQISLNKSDSELPPAVRDRVNTSSPEFLSALLQNCTIYQIKNVRELFQ